MYVTPEQIYEVTNGGLDVILSYYPQAAECTQNHTKKFRVRPDDKTASASLKQVSGGIWVVTDFGGDQKPRNCIEVTRLQENCTFKEAVALIAAKFNIVAPDMQREVFKAEFTSRDANDDEKDGEYFFDFKEEFTERELKELFAEKVIEHYQSTYADWKQKLNEVCEQNSFKSLVSFTQIKNRKAIISASTENYPIFLIDGDTFKKIYQPKNIDKQYRFRYTGTRPKDYIFGLKVLKEKYAQQIEKFNQGLSHYNQLEEVIICSGDRDSLNVAALGYNVIWLNSETAKLNWNTFKDLVKMCKSVYNLPDIDTTGKREGHELAMQYLEIKTIWLPDVLREHKDWRGNPCKDLRDYLRFYSHKAFKKLVETALPYKFWDVKVQDEGLKYRVNSLQMYNFLQRNGWHRFRLENEKEGYTYVHINNNVVKQVKPIDIRSYIHNFLEAEKKEIELRNTFYDTTRLNENSISNLQEIEIDFNDFDKHSQYMFFMNKTWRIDKAGVTEYLPSAVSKYVWENEVIKHRVEVMEAPFVITENLQADGTTLYDIEIKRKDCLFLNYLINASRIHWRKEFEEVWLPDEEQERLKYIQENKFNIAGPKLSPAEIQEQKMHLINKIYAYGYLLHRYKDSSRPWCVFAMDNKPSEEGESHGGTGKSIAFKSLCYFMNSVQLDGRNRKLTDNPFVYEIVTEHTDYILIDDADQYLNFNFFFAPLTGSLTVNPKFGKQFIIPFEKVPKFAITSNYTLRQLDPSTERRILYTVFSDYYHFNTNNEYKESRSPKDDFGKNLFQEFTPAEWNLFFNTAAYCCSTYLNFDKIEPPLANVTMRNLMTEMGASFQEWADVYFSEGSGKRDELVSKNDAFEDFKKSSNSKLWSSQKFNKSLKAWCRFNHFELDPVELQNAQGRIIRKAIVKTFGRDGSVIEKKQSVEMIYIKTLKEINKAALQPELPEQTNMLGVSESADESKDLPF